MRLRRFSPIVAVTVAILGVPSVAGAQMSSSSGPNGAVAVSPTSTNSTERSPVTLLAGSAEYLVFSRPTGQLSVDPRFNSTPMYVTNLSDAVRSLGVRPAGIRFSIAGDLLTSISWKDETTVSWVDLSDGTSGSGSIPSGGSYLGATATGWAYVKSNELFTETTSGTSTSLGFPLGNAPGEDVTLGGTGPDGALVADGTSAVAYVPYDDPSHPVTLSTLDLANSDPAAHPVSLICQALATVAFCGTSPTSVPDSFATGERLSLSGGAPVVVSNSSDPNWDQVALDDQTTATSTFEGTEVSNADGSDRTAIKGFGASVTSAFNEIAVTDATNAAIELIDAPSDPPTDLVAPTSAVVEADDANATSGRVVYTDDQVSPSSHGSPYVWERPVRNVDGTIKLGTPDYVGALPDDSVYEEFRQSGPLTSSATTAVSLFASNYGPPTEILRPVHPTFIPWNEQSQVLALSGNRALTDGGQRVVDTVTGKASRVAKHPRAWALWGPEYCFMASSGAVSCKNLDTGVKTDLRGAVASDANNEVGEVAVYANHVSWNDTQSSHHGVLVDVHHPHQRTALPAGMTVVALTSNGVLLAKYSQSDRMDTYYLRGYGQQSTSRALVTVPDEVGFLDRNVSVDQSVLTWLDGPVVKAAPVRHVADPPRYLGDPVAPLHLNLAKKTGWKAYLPYSASLTHCTITIKRGHHTLRTLRCAGDPMKYGGAVVSWTGRDAHGEKVSPGKVRWIAHVGNRDGAGRTSEGAKKSIVGTITIRR